MRSRDDDNGDILERCMKLEVRKNDSHNVL